MTAAVGVAPSAGKRRFCYHAVTSGEGGRRTCEGSREKAQRIFRSQRVYSAFLATVKNSGAQTVSPDEVPVQALFRFFLLDFTRGKVHEEYSAHIASGHVYPLSSTVDNIYFLTSRRFNPAA